VGDVTVEEDSAVLQVHSGCITTTTTYPYYHTTPAVGDLVVVVLAGPGA
jgi:hypothetical protein